MGQMEQSQKANSLESESGVGGRSGRGKGRDYRSAWRNGRNGWRRLAADGRNAWAGGTAEAERRR